MSTSSEPEMIRIEEMERPLHQEGGASVGWE
jgi:hypothetical protein